MKILLLLSTLLSYQAIASGPDCWENQEEYFPNSTVKDYGLFRGRFSCTNHYWSETSKYVTAEMESKNMNHKLRSNTSIKSCKEVESLSNQRWNEYRNYGLPVDITVHFLNKSTVTSDCDPKEVVGHPCAFTIRSKDSNISFKSKNYDVKQFGECWEILNRIVIRD